MRVSSHGSGQTSNHHVARRAQENNYQRSSRACHAWLCDFGGADRGHCGCRTVLRAVERWSFRCYVAGPGTGQCRTKPECTTRGPIDSIGHAGELVSGLKEGEAFHLRALSDNDSGPRASDRLGPRPPFADRKCRPGFAAAMRADHNFRHRPPRVVRIIGGDLILLIRKGIRRPDAPRPQSRG